MFSRKLYLQQRQLYLSLIRQSSTKLWDEVKVAGAKENRSLIERLSGKPKEPVREFMKKHVKSESVLRHVKYKEKKGKLEVPCQIDLYVIASGARSTPKSVVLITSNNSYLFNCGEDTQRTLLESRCKVTKIDNIFITSKSWENVGGLFGMVLILEQNIKRKVTLHGPPGVETLFKDSILFAEDDKAEVVRPPPWVKDFSDESVQIDYVPLLPEEIEKGYNSAELGENNYPSADKHDTQTAEGTSAPPKKKQKVSDFTPLTDPNVTMAYIIKPHAKPRNVNMGKCVDLGIEEGRMVGQLKNGESVTLPNGNVVHPDQVLEKQEICKPIIVVDCPSENHLYSLLRSKQLEVCQQNDNNAAEMVVHMSSYNIVQNPKYQKFIKRFPKSTVHMFLHEKTTSLLGFKNMDFHSRLNLLNPVIFPPIHYIEQQSSSVKRNHVIARPNLRYKYRPDKGVSSEYCAETDTASTWANVKKQIMKDENFMKIINNYRSLVDTSPKTTKDEEPDFPEVVFLGTGSSVPCTYRSVSCILVNMDEDTSLIMDCGDGSCNQLYKMYGDKTDEILMKIKAIYISHTHADHHLGLTTLVNERRNAFIRAGKEESKILLLAPPQMGPWLQNNSEHAGVMELKQILNMIPTIQLVMKEHRNKYVRVNEDPDPAITQLILDKLNCTEFLTAPVKHNRNACGVSFKHKSGWKIVYSGDCMPSEALIDIGINCDLLIHEATFQDELEADARFKRHSTVSQAVQVGVKMNAKYQILTHFSQRYAKIPVINNEMYKNNIGIAYDFMKVRLGDLRLLNGMINPLKEIFKSDLEMLQMTQHRRDMKEKLRRELMEGAQS